MSAPVSSNMMTTTVTVMRIMPLQETSDISQRTENAVRKDVLP